MRSDLSTIANDELISSVHSLVRRTQALDADLLLHLGELDARQLYRDRAFGSMFSYCVGELGFSEDAAFNRIEVARLARRLPAVLDRLRSGALHLTGLRLLAPHLNVENHVSVLDAAAKKSKRQIEELVATLAPKPPVPESIRKLPQPTTATPDLLLAPEQATAPSRLPSPDLLELTAPPAQPPSRVQPLSAETFKVQFTASRALRDKITEAKELLRRSVPEGDLSVVLEKALDLLIAKVKKERFGVGRKPRVPPQKEPTLNANVTLAPVADHPVPSKEPAPRQPQTQKIGRHIPNSIKREVYLRDGGRCTFVSDDGRRCGTGAALEFDHLDGFARTHEHLPERISLRCAAHNQLGAERLYGRDFVRRARASTRPGATPTDLLL